MTKIWRLIASTLAFTLIAPLTLTVFVPWLLLPAHPAVSHGALFVASLALLSCGALTYVWCAWDFIYAGHGTPAPYHAPKLLVSRGLYRYTRNPMYLGIAAALAGEVILFRSLAVLIYSLVVVIGFHLRVLLYEEPVLSKIFGAQFEEYCCRVPRWLIR